MDNTQNFGKKILAVASTIEVLLYVIDIIAGVAVGSLVGEITYEGFNFLCFLVVSGSSILLTWVLSLFTKGFGQLISDTWELKVHFVGEAKVADESMDEVQESMDEIQLYDVSNCLYCGNTLHPQDKTCAKCGAWKCRGCGRWNSDNVNRCKECDWAQ